MSDYATIHSMAVITTAQIARRLRSFHLDAPWLPSGGECSALPRRGPPYRMRSPSPPCSALDRVLLAELKSEGGIRM